MDNEGIDSGSEHGAHSDCDVSQSAPTAYARIQQCFATNGAITARTLSSTLAMIPACQVATESDAEREASSIRSMYTDSFELFSESELRLYNLANKFRWTEEELQEFIALIRSPVFDPRHVCRDLQSRVCKSSYFDVYLDTFRWWICRIDNISINFDQNFIQDNIFR